MYRGAGNPRSIRNAAPSTDLSYVAKRIEDAFGKYETALQKDKGAALFQPLPAKRQRQLDKFLGQRMDYFEQKGDKDMVSAIKHYMVQTMMKAEEAKISEDYQKSFFAWLMGQGKQSDHTRTPWGREPHALELPSVRKVLEQILEALYITKTYLIKLIFRAPQTLGEYAIYYKYILHCEDWIASEDAWIFLEFPALIDGAKWFEGENGLGRFMDDGEPRNPPGENLNNPPSKQRSDAVRQILHCLDNSLFTPGQPDPVAVLVKEEAMAQGLDITDAQAEEAAKAIKDDPVKREQVEKAIEKKSAVANEKKKEEAERATQEQQAKIASDWARAADALKVIAEGKKRKEEALQRQTSEQNRAKLAEEQKAADRRVKEAALSERERLKRVEEEGKNIRKQQEERSVAQNKKKAEQHRLEQQRKLEETKKKASKPRRVQPVVQPAPVVTPPPPPADLPITVPTPEQPPIYPPGYQEPTAVYDPNEFSTTSVPQLTSETVQRRTGETVGAEIAEEPPDYMDVDPIPEQPEQRTAEFHYMPPQITNYIEQQIEQPLFAARFELTNDVNQLLQTRREMYVPDVIVNESEIVEKITNQVRQVQEQTQQIQDAMPSIEQSIRASIPLEVPDEERHRIVQGARQKMQSEFDADKKYIEFAKRLVAEKPLPQKRGVEEIVEVLEEIPTEPVSQVAELTSLLLVPPQELQGKSRKQTEDAQMRKMKRLIAKQKARQEQEEAQLQADAKEFQEQNLAPEKLSWQKPTAITAPKRETRKAPTFLMNQPAEKPAKFVSRSTQNWEAVKKRLLGTVKEIENALANSSYQTESRRQETQKQWENLVRKSETIQAMNSPVLTKEPPTEVVEPAEKELHGIKAEHRGRSKKLRSEAVAKLREAAREQTIAGRRVTELVEQVQSESKKGSFVPEDIQRAVGKLNVHTLQKIASNPTPENKKIMQNLVKTLVSAQSKSGEFKTFTKTLQELGSYHPKAQPAKTLAKKKDRTVSRRPQGMIVAGRKVVA